MAKKRHDGAVLEVFQEAGGLTSGTAAQVAQRTGVPEASAFGAASFFHLLNDPSVKVRVCQGLSCGLAGAKELLQSAKDLGLPAEGCSCLAACDQVPAVLRDRETLGYVTRADLERSGGDWQKLTSAAHPEAGLGLGFIGPDGTDEALPMNLGSPPDFSGGALSRALELGADDVIEAVDASGLQGRGGAGFPAAFKWRAVRKEQSPSKYFVLNADEGEPGTFKDREILLRRPDRVIEGMLIAARMVGANAIYCYLRGEFQGPWRALDDAAQKFRAAGLMDDIEFHLHAGHGAYICGEETALLEALEGKRGMPRLKPPFPTQKGLWQRPTLIHNVETIACVPSIVMRGGEWFKNLGRTGPGTKLYSISGHVKKPGIFELPLGVTLDELVAHAGGYDGELKAFHPGGPSSGFLPAQERDRPLDFKALQEVDSMLGSAGVVVLNDTVDMLWAARQLLRFFEVESCGQCAPCRIGTRFQREALDRAFKLRADGADKSAIASELEHSGEVAWEMNEGSICGLGQVAALPLTSMLQHFPEVLENVQD